MSLVSLVPSPFQVIYLEVEILWFMPPMYLILTTHDIPHVISCTRCSRFSVYNIESWVEPGDEPVVNVQTFTVWHTHVTHPSEYISGCECVDQATDSFTLWFASMLLCKFCFLISSLVVFHKVTCLSSPLPPTTSSYVFLTCGIKNRSKKYKTVILALRVIVPVQ